MVNIMSFNITQFVEFSNGRAACPACISYHGKKERNTNLSLIPGSDGAYKCHRGCTPEEIRSALNYQPERKPEWTPSGYSKPAPKPTSATYPESEIQKNHRNLEEGKIAGLEARKWLDDRGITAEVRKHFQLGVSRRRSKGNMTFSIDIPLPAGDGTYYRKGRIAPWEGEKNWTQYGIPQHIFWSHKPEGFTSVWLCAGEWDAMRLGWELRHQSKIAVATFTCGEGSVPPAERIAELQGKACTIFYDRDEVGEKGAAKVCAAVEGARVAEVPAPEPVPSGWDITDFFNAGYPIDLLHKEAANSVKPTEAIVNAKPKKLRDRLVTNDELMARAPDVIEYLVPDLMTSNELFLLATSPRGGKTLMAMTLAHAVATGGKFLGRPCTQGAVIYVNLEDADAKIKEREIQQGWGEGLPIYWLDKFKLAELPDLIEAAAEIQPRLIVLDTLSRIKDSNTSEASAEMSQVLEPLQEFAKLYDCAVLLVHHTKKVNDAAAAGTVDVFDAIRGSSAIRATARGAWILAAGEKSHRLIVEHGHGRCDLEIYLNLKNLTWMELGKWKINADADQADQILAYLNEYESGSVSEIASAMGIPKKSCQVALWRLQLDDMVLKSGGRRNTPATYTRSSNLLPQLPQITQLLPKCNPDGVGDSGDRVTKNEIFSSENGSNGSLREGYDPEVIRNDPEMIRSDQTDQPLQDKASDVRKAENDPFDPVESSSVVTQTKKAAQTQAPQGLHLGNNKVKKGNLLPKPDHEIGDPVVIRPDHETVKTDQPDHKIDSSVIENGCNNLLPIGTWIRRSNGEISQCSIHYPHGPGFSRPDGTLLGFLDASEYEAIDEPSILLRKGITIASKVKFSQEAIAQQLASREKFRASMGREDPTPWEANWIYEVVGTTPEGDCLLKREGDRKRKPSKKLNARWLEVVKT
jgi:AAA domain